MTRTIWCDVESDGLTRRHRPWEIALIVRDESSPDADVEYVWQLRHDMRDADPYALSIGRYYERCQVADWEVGTGTAIVHPKMGADHEPLFHRDIAAEIAALLPGAVFTAQNPAFDAGMVSGFLRANGHCATHDYHLRDVGTLIRGYLHGLAAVGELDPADIPVSLGLDGLVRAIGIDPRDYDRHTGIGDARMERDATDVVTGRLQP
jgi:hypothetical protein